MPSLARSTVTSFSKCPRPPRGPRRRPERSGGNPTKRYRRNVGRPRSVAEGIPRSATGATWDGLSGSRALSGIDSSFSVPTQNDLTVLVDGGHVQFHVLLSFVFRKILHHQLRVQRIAGPDLMGEADAE